MNLFVNPNDKTPIYRQLYEQIASEILSGALAPGTPLPPIRTVSRELGVSMITVRGAWDMLERDGYLLTRAGSGCFVAPLNETHRQSKVDERLSAAVDALVSDAKALGVTEDALLELIKAKY
jgi:GntR family transcriptional regulator